MSFDSKMSSFDSLWKNFDRMWENFDKNFDRMWGSFDNKVISEETAKVETTIRVSLTKKQVMGLLTGEHKRLLFKVKDGVDIQVEIQP